MNDNLWYAVQISREDNDWGYGSFDKAEAVEMAKIAGVEMAKRPSDIIIAIIDGDVCIKELFNGEDFQESEVFITMKWRLIIKPEEGSVCWNNGFKRMYDPSIFDTKKSAMEYAKKLEEISNVKVLDIVKKQKGK